jgi:hypothetical protein
MNYVPRYRGEYDSVAETRYYEARPHLARLDGSVSFDTCNKVLTTCEQPDTISECLQSNETKTTTE